MGTFYEVTCSAGGASPTFYKLMLIALPGSSFFSHMADCPRALVLVHIWYIQGCHRVLNVLFVVPIGIQLSVYLGTDM